MPTPGKRQSERFYCIGLGRSLVSSTLTLLKGEKKEEKKQKKQRLIQIEPNRMEKWKVHSCFAHQGLSHSECFAIFVCVLVRADVCIILSCC